MRLSLERDLEARFLKITAPDTHKWVDAMEDAQGVIFLCPKCFAANGGPVGTHSIICWSRSRGNPEERNPKPGRWALRGTSMADLSLDGDAPGGGGDRSVLLTAGCGWHGFVDDGFAHGDIPDFERNTQ